MTTPRYSDWRDRLLVYLRTTRKRKFRPGRWDCGLFVAGAAKAMTGVNHARDLRGKYSSIEKGKELLRSMGYEDHVDFVAHLYPEIPVAFASVGDVAVVVDRENIALGIVQGERIWVLRRDGLVTVDLITATRAFKI